MAKTRAQKELLIKGYSDKAKKAKSMVFINFKGLKVKDAVAFRKKCQGEGADYMVVKKTLMNIVFKNEGLGLDAREFSGDVGTVFGFEDEVTAMKVTQDFAKTHEAIKPLGGILERAFVDSAKILELSRLSSRIELFAKLAGSLNSPLSGFVNVLAGNLRGLVLVFQAIGKKKASWEQFTKFNT